MKRTLRSLTKKIAALATSMLLVGMVNAQVSGVVKDQTTGETIIGATVVVKGKTTGSTTDVNGKYTVNASGSDTLIYWLRYARNCSC